MTVVPERKPSAWEVFVKKRGLSPIPDIDPLFALPTKLIQAIEKHAKGFWSKEELRFEEDLVYCSGGMFIGHRRERNLSYRQFVLEDDFDDIPLSPFELRGNVSKQEYNRRTRTFNKDTLNRGKYKDGQIEGILSDIDSLEAKVQKSQIAYAGWLIVNEEFLAELNCLKEKAPSSVGQYGRFPVMSGGFGRSLHEELGKRKPGYWAPTSDSERKYDEHCQYFLERWCLRSLINWDIPAPVLGSDSLGRNPPMCGVHIFLPWYVFKNKTPEIPRAVQAMVAAQFSGPLGTWLKKGDGSKTLAYYERLFRMYVYFGLAICRRYKDKVSESPGRLDMAFMEYFGLLVGDDDVRDVDSVSKVRQKLQKSRHFYS